VLRIADENAGKRIKCPGCQAIGTAPSAPTASAAPKFELVEDDAPPKPAPAAKAKSVPAKPAKADDDDGFEVVEDEDDKPKAKKKPVLSKGSRRDEDDEEDEKPKKKAKPRRDEDDDDDDEPRARRKPADPDAGKKIMYLIGGLLMVLAGAVIAFLWYQNEPHTGRRPYSGYILGVCLVIVGLGTAGKGITGNFDDDE
jgi:hypothetical protein